MENQNSPLSEALRAQIVELVSKGDDKSGGRLTPEVLAKVVRVAKTGRDLLVSLDANGSNLAGMVKRPQPGLGISPFGFAPPVPQVDDGLGDDASVQMMASPYAPAPSVENFGMTALRELISAAKNFNGKGDSSPVKLVEALVIAREKGLDDVARELESQLGMKKPVEPVKAIEEGVAK